MIQVLHPGLFTTVQDLGRDGWTHLGVSPCGAFDPLALQLGNWLVGNPPGAAALEMTLLGGRFQFERRAVIAITGKWSSFSIEAGEIVNAGPVENGARAYLCVSGGLVVDPVFGSASTHVLSRLGGHEGRALRRGDRLAFGPSQAGPRSLPPDLEPLTQRTCTLRVTPGAQASGFSAQAAMTLLSSEFTVRDDSNRMGLRLSGPSLDWAGGEMVSEGVPLGAIQVPPSGEPILLGVDAQTTGGYPVIASIITADLPSLGQLRPRDRIRFEAVSLDTAWRLAREQAALLRQLS